LGIAGDRRVRRSLGPSMRLLRRQFIRVFLCYCAAGAIGVLGFLFFLWIWTIGQTSHLILPVFLISQIGLLCLLASRIWQRGILATLVLATEATHTVILVQSGPPDPYPLTPTPYEPNPDPEPGSEPSPQPNPEPRPEPGDEGPLLPAPPLTEPA